MSDEFIVAAVNRNPSLPLNQLLGDQNPTAEGRDTVMKYLRLLENKVQSMIDSSGNEAQINTWVTTILSNLSDASVNSAIVGASAAGLLGAVFDRININDGYINSTVLASIPDFAAIVANATAASATFQNRRLIKALCINTANIALMWTGVGLANNTLAVIPPNQTTTVVGVANNAVDGYEDIRLHFNGKCLVTGIGSSNNQNYTQIYTSGGAILYQPTGAVTRSTGTNVVATCLLMNGVSAYTIGTGNSAYTRTVRLISLV